ncbi:ABC transporter ATP-binding protein [Campylobacter sp. FMV-PI01]|uniref:ABC transporter ATP-binding protein n=1 Tax=Campylobacter portucalensis TaxID=2608384 RepID=A0A6L5WHF4_9BACT|nr:ABC transporter ATP-binding protein [Campylobacter portucalensis]MSN96509.1 ABC transporter ATP-binding protein [Campylobacter portucalensis]
MIEVKNISKIFNENKNNEFCALKNVNFSVKKGEIFFLKGVSGSGKSTLLNIMAGLLKPSEGEIFMDGENISKLSIKFASKFRREKIGMIFQNFNLIPTLSVFDNIIIPTLPDKLDKKAFAFELLDKFNIFSKKYELTKNLSGGEQQRVAIIRALINNPSIILADEPSANLDRYLSEKLIEYFFNIKGITIVISTHDPLLLESGIGSAFYEMKKD